jgi:hypothetical protein
VFPRRYELNFYILFRRNSVFKGLKCYVSETVEYLGSLGFHNNDNYFIKEEKNDW